MANWNKNDALFCISEDSLSAYVLFMASSFQGKNILIPSKCWGSPNHGECTWILRFMITILLSAVSGWLSQQSCKINIKIVGQENYLSEITPRRCLVLNLKQTQLFAAALAAPLSSFPCCPNKMRSRFLFCQHMTGRNFLYLTYFLYFTAVSMQ